MSILADTMFEDNGEDLPDLDPETAKLVADAINAELDALKAEIRVRRREAAAREKHPTAEPRQDGTSPTPER